MKTIVIYNSETGFTKRYAQWIAEKASAECVEYSKAKKLNLESYDTIVFGGWAIAGSISKIKWFKKKIANLQGKKLVAFCVGASPIENPDLDEFFSKWSADDEVRNTKLFYCPGGLNYEKMSVKSKAMIKMFVKMLNAKKDKTEEDLYQIKMLSSSYDISDKKYIEPIIEYIGI
jgi:menaquinone-dependent protoporphyrinogen IX oxidase